MTTKNILIVAGLALLGYVLLGFFSLSMAQESLAGKRGEVWNQIDRADQLLTRLEGQLEYGVEELSEINQAIVEARAGVQSAQKDGDLEGALAAAGEANLAINVLIEAYPEYYDLSEVFVGLQDETAGTFNRITYARDNLIDAQVSFNRSRILFTVVGFMFEREDVLGANTDPMAQVRESTLGDGK